MYIHTYLANTGATRGRGTPSKRTYVCNNHTQTQLLALLWTLSGSGARKRGMKQTFKLYHQIF